MAGSRHACCGSRSSAGHGIGSHRPSPSPTRLSKHVLGPSSGDLRKRTPPRLRGRAGHAPHFKIHLIPVHFGQLALADAGIEGCGGQRFRAGVRQRLIKFLELSLPKESSPDVFLFAHGEVGNREVEFAIRLQCVMQDSAERAGLRVFLRSFAGSLSRYSRKVSVVSFCGGRCPKNGLMWRGSPE